ncbi:MAG: FAD-binding protein [Pseudomonadales bacterium]
MIDELRALVRGEVLCGARALDAHSTDFGGAEHLTPAAIVRPRDAEDISAVLSFASDNHINVSTRGSGHSVAGQTLTDGIVISMRGSHSGPMQWTTEDVVEIGAGRTWRQVEAFTARRHRQIGVLADYLGLSVGGTISVGGYGVDSVRLGPQTDSVRRLRLVQPDGSIVWCSQRERPGLFRHALAGLGRAGVIDRVEMSTEPRRPWTALAARDHPSLTSMIDSLEWLQQTPDPPALFKALAARGRCVSTYGTVGDSRREALAGLAALPGHVDRSWVFHSYRRWRDLGVRLWTGTQPGREHIWADYLMPYPALRTFVRELERLRKSSEIFRRCLKAVFVLAVCRQAHGTRPWLEATSLIEEPMAFGIGLYSMTRRDALTRSAVAAALTHCLDLTLNFGGRPYLYGWHNLNQDQLLRTYGTGDLALNRLGLPEA